MALIKELDTSKFRVGDFLKLDENNAGNFIKCNESDEDCLATVVKDGKIAIDEAGKS
jgi:hypothetical protein